MIAQQTADPSTNKAYSKFSFHQRERERALEEEEEEKRRIVRVIENRSINSIKNSSRNKVINYKL